MKILSALCGSLAIAASNASEPRIIEGAHHRVWAGPEGSYSKRR